MKIIPIENLHNFKPQESIPQIRRIHENLDEVIKSAEKQKIQGTPSRYWPFFNRAFGGIRGGELIVLTADTGSGKSTFARNLYQDISHSKIPSLMITLEDDVESFRLMLSQMEIGKKPETFSKEDWVAYDQSIRESPMFYLDHSDSLSFDLLCKSIAYACEKHQMKFIIIDHFGYVKLKYIAGVNESKNIEMALQTLAQLSRKYNVCIMLLAHPTKSNQKGFDKDDFTEVNPDELKGSASFKQEANAVFTLFRKRNGSGETILRFAKIRHRNYSKFSHHKIYFSFLESNLRFEELTHKNLTDGDIE